MRFSDSMLLESKAVRDQGLSEIASIDVQVSLLSRVKSAFFALWRGTRYMTPDEVADFYQVSRDSIDKNRQRHEDEFFSDGMLYVTGQDLRELKLADILSASSSNARHVYLFSPRAVLRMGFILRDSAVAVQVRTAALNVIQGVGDFVSSESVLYNLILGNPPYRAFVEHVNDRSSLRVAAPLEPYYDAIARHLKSTYPNGGIPGLNKTKIRERLSALSTYTQSWKLNTQKEFSYQLKTGRAKYPDFVSEPIQICVDGEAKQAAFIFQIEDLLIGPEHIEECLGRQYIKRVKNTLGVDFVYLFFVSPFGATPDTQAYIHDELPSDHRGFVGVVTVKEFAGFLRDQAWQERSKGLIKGDINKQFEQLLTYQYPDPLAVMMGLAF